MCAAAGKGKEGGSHREGQCHTGAETQVEHTDKKDIGTGGLSAAVGSEPGCQVLRRERAVGLESQVTVNTF
jgi:hypothetical protein